MTALLTSGRIARQVWAVAASAALIPALGAFQVRDALGEVPAAISGVVADSRSGEPVVGAGVYLGRDAARQNRRAYQITDAEGRYVFTDLPAGIYSIRGSKAGFADGHYGLPPLGRDIRVRPGEWFKTADVKLRRLGSISGQVTDENGGPLIGVPVRALLELHIGRTNRIVAGPTATTDDRGHYRLSDLHAGRYFVMVPSVQSTVPIMMTPADVEGRRPESLAQMDELARSRGQWPARLNQGVIADGPVGQVLGSYPIPPSSEEGSTLAYPPTFYPDVDSIRVAVPIELDPGVGREGIDFVLRPVRAVTLSGRVEGHAGSGGRVMLRLVAEGLEQLGMGSETATALVNRDGTFTLKPVPPGRYLLLAPGASAEYQLRRQDVDLPATPGVSRSGFGVSGANVGTLNDVSFRAFVPDSLIHEGVGYVRQPLEVGSEDVNDLVLTLRRTATVRLRVTYDHGEGPPPVSAEFVPASGDPTLTYISITRARFEPDRKGYSVTLGGVLPGAYVVRFRDFDSYTLRSLLVSGVDYRGRAVSVFGSDVTELTAVFTDAEITVHGVVHTEAGVPATDAVVIAFSAARTRWLDYGLVPQWVRFASAASDGSYTFRRLFDGEYYIAAIPEARLQAWQNPGFLESLTREARKVSLDWDTTLSLDLRVVANPK